MHDAADGATFASVNAGLNPLRAAQAGAARIRDLTNQWRGYSVERVAGRIAEEWHASTFNVDAASRHIPLRATTTEAQGYRFAPSDVAIADAAGNKIVDAQLKYHVTPARTTVGVAGTQYDGMQRIVPSDQLDQVRELARIRGTDGVGRYNYPDTANHATDRIHAGGAESSPLTRANAIEAARNPTEAGARLVRKHMGKAIANGALAGAAVGGGVSAISNCIAFAKGTKSRTAAAVDTLKDTAGCTASGAAVGGLALVAETALVRMGASALASGAAPVALALTAVDLAKDAARLVTGGIDRTAFTRTSAGHIVKGGLTWAGMEGGAALGTAVVPGVGTVVGAIVGGITGALLGGLAASRKRSSA